MNNELRLKQLEVVLPPAPAPKGAYAPVLIDGRYAYVSGHLPLRADGSMIQGKVGQDLNMHEGKLAARQVGLTILSSLISKLGSLNRVKRLIKVLGMVNATADFEKHPFVINGCSELFIEVFGPENGVGARSAFGVASLPENIAVEIEAIFELTEE
jgi:enamine deaminase RidA (YjgF/YER057c/UK114 family)